MAESVTIFEAGPRDGLQNEVRLIPAAEKIRLVNLLSAAGLRKIEVTSFVSQKAVPQMADGAEVFAGIDRRMGVSYAALTPNMQGYRAARLAHADEVAVFASASEGFSQHNINCSIDESIARFAPVLAAARGDGVPVRGYVSCVIKCPYDGDTDPANVASVAKQLFDLGCYEISLGDTIGVGTPDTVSAMIDAVAKLVPVEHLAGHFHNTNGRALDNIEVSLRKGLRVFDSSAGGLGGCPFAPGAAGNVDTCDVVTFLERLGYVTGIDADSLEDAAAFARTLRTAP